jgi:hypothetical protein
MTVRNPDLVKHGIQGGVLIGEDSGRDGKRKSRGGERDSLVIVDSRGEDILHEEEEEDDDRDDNEAESAALEDHDDSTSTTKLIFLPPDPTYYFRRLYELVLHYDYSLMSSLPPDEDVSLSILSPLHETFLLLVRKRWRVPVTLKAASFVGLVAGLYKGMGVPEECVGEALEEVDRVDEKWRYWRWPLVDVSSPSPTVSLSSVR